jgi:hypothetical protein
LIYFFKANEYERKFYTRTYLKLKVRTVAQAVGRWLPTAEARVRVRAGMWGLAFVVNKAALE